LLQFINSNKNDEIFIGGVDEAGRGSILGPMVIAGIGIRKSQISGLYKLDVKDSKLLSPKRRSQIFSDILGLADSVSVFIINCSQVDLNVFFNRLNRLEAETMALIINNIHADRVYIDSCDVNPERYKHCIESYLDHSSTKTMIHSLHHADRLNVVVSAASIIAKIIRDYEILQIRKVHPNIGSGYPSDKKTMGFIKKWVNENQSAPEFARKSWKPLRTMLEERSQQLLL
jgi:ribonuclease HII